MAQSRAGFPSRQATRQPSEKAAAYAEFFGKLLSRFRDLYPGETNVTKPSKDNWQTMSIGRSGFLTNWSFTADRFRVELSLDTGDTDVNKAYFEQLHQDSGDIERQVGHTLEWDEVEGRRARRVYSYYTKAVTVLDNKDQLDELTMWAVEEMKRFRDAFRPRIQALQV